MSDRERRPKTTAAPWPDPPELAHMAPQFRLGYRQAQQETVAEIAQLRALVTRLTEAAESLARESSDPGSEALAAIYCGKHFIYG